MKPIEQNDCIIIEPESKAQACIIWMHGLGADGNDFVPVARELRLKTPTRFIFPHAPVQAVTINGGMKMRSWYDILNLSFNGREDENGVRESQSRVQSLLDAQIKQGIAADKIILAGFSQGGAVALHTGLRAPQKLAGIIALSTYLPVRDKVKQEANAENANTPIFFAHGSLDPVVPMMMGQHSHQILTELGYTTLWNEYPMQHQVCMEEINDIAGFIRRQFGE